MTITLLSTPEEFRQRAIECDRLAKRARRPSERETMTFAAARWREMADEVEAKRGRQRSPVARANSRLGAVRPKPKFPKQKQLA
jgi:hypothetical protein